MVFIERLARKKHVTSDKAVEPSISLPPKVESAPKCYLKVTFGEIRWFVSHPESYLVRVRFWGEEGSGTFFKPYELGSAEDQAIRSTCRYIIRSGPNNFCAYLRDMESLNPEIVAGSNQLVVLGTAEIRLASFASPGNFLNAELSGTVTFSNASQKKLAEATYAIKVETLTALHDERDATKRGTGVAKRSDEAQQSAKQQTDSSKPSSETKKPPTPRGVVDRDRNRKATKPSSSEALAKPDGRDSSEREDDLNLSPASALWKGSHDGAESGSAKGHQPAAFDLINDLFERSEKLRNQLILAQLDGSTASQRRHDPLDASEPSSSRSDRDGSPKRTKPSVGRDLSSYARPQQRNPELRTLDLLLGDLQSNADALLTNTSRLGEEDTDVLSSADVTELDDALHDESVLNRLFYTQSAAATAKREKAAEKGQMDEDDDESTLSEDSERGRTAPRPTQPPINRSLETAAAQPQKGQDSFVLNVLFWIPHGRNMLATPMAGSQQHLTPQSGNFFAVTKLFWLADGVRSDVAWNTNEPFWNILHTSPLIMNATTLQKLKDNYIIVEIWNRRTTQNAGASASVTGPVAFRDELVGIAKVPLHPFYISYHDRVIADTLLQAEFPVVAADCYIPVVRLATGEFAGEVHVLAAAGSERQVNALKQLKVQQSPHLFGQPTLSRRLAPLRDEMTRPSSFIEHCFDIVVDSIENFSIRSAALFDGDADDFTSPSKRHAKKQPNEMDCYVQYTFPAQHAHTDVSLRAFRSRTIGVPLDAGATTAPRDRVTCGHFEKHRFVLPAEQSVAASIANAFSSVETGSGRLLFECWLRTVSIGIREKMVAKAILPLSKFYSVLNVNASANVGGGSVKSSQSFRVPLQLSGGPLLAASNHHGDAYLNITVHYSNTLLPATTLLPQAAIAGIDERVCVSIGVNRATGLRRALVNALSLDDSTIGDDAHANADWRLNSYVKVCLPREFSRTSGVPEKRTRVVANEYAPDFSYQFDAHLPLSWVPSANDSDEYESDDATHTAYMTPSTSTIRTLAEGLERAELRFEVWHTPTAARRGKTTHGEEASDDILIGVASVRLVELLRRRGGFRGWTPLLGVYSASASRARLRDGTLNEDSLMLCKTEEHEALRGKLEDMVGALDVSVNFARPADSRRVVSVSRECGWQPHSADLVALTRVDEELTSNSVLPFGYKHVRVSLGSVQLPSKATLFESLGLRRRLQRTASSLLEFDLHVFAKYKFFEHRPVVIRLAELTTDGRAELDHRRGFRVCCNASLAAFLREERLPVQIWLKLVDNGRLTTHERSSLVEGGESRHADWFVDQADAEREIDEATERGMIRDETLYYFATAYVNLHTLGDFRKVSARVSDSYPLVRSNAPDLHCAAVNVSVSITSQLGEATRVESDWEEANNDDESLTTVSSDDTPVGTRRRTGGAATWKKTKQSAQDERSFPVHLLITRATNLAVEHRASRPAEERDARVFVTCSVYKSAGLSSAATNNEAQLQTEAVAAANPLWNFETDARLSRDLLTNTNLSFILKVWQRTSTVDSQAVSGPLGSDRVIGFASVDLQPLLFDGMTQVCGWYNVVDFNGATRGQILVSVVPLEVERIREWKATARGSRSPSKDVLTRPTGTGVRSGSPKRAPERSRTLLAAGAPFSSAALSNIAELNFASTDHCPVVHSTLSTTDAKSTLQRKLAELDTLTDRLVSRLRSIDEANAAPTASEASKRTHRVQLVVPDNEPSSYASSGVEQRRSARSTDTRERDLLKQPAASASSPEAHPDTARSSLPGVSMSTSASIQFDLNDTQTSFDFDAADDLLASARRMIGDLSDAGETPLSTVRHNDEAHPSVRQGQGDEQQRSQHELEAAIRISEQLDAANRERLNEQALDEYEDEDDDDDDVETTEVEPRLLNGSQLNESLRADVRQSQHEDAVNSQAQRVQNEPTTSADDDDDDDNDKRLNAQDLAPVSKAEEYAVSTQSRGHAAEQELPSDSRTIPAENERATVAVQPEAQVGADVHVHDEEEFDDEDEAEAEEADEIEDEQNYDENEELRLLAEIDETLRRRSEATQRETIDQELRRRIDEALRENSPIGHGSASRSAFSRADAHDPPSAPEEQRRSQYAPDSTTKPKFVEQPAKAREAPSEMRFFASPTELQKRLALADGASPSGMNAPKTFGDRARETQAPRRDLTSAFATLPSASASASASTSATASASTTVSTSESGQASRKQPPAAALPPANEKEFERIAKIFYSKPT